MKEYKLKSIHFQKLFISKMNDSSQAAFMFNSQDFTVFSKVCT